MPGSEDTVRAPGSGVISFSKLFVESFEKRDTNCNCGYHVLKVEGVVKNAETRVDNTWTLSWTCSKINKEECMYGGMQKIQRRYWDEHKIMV